MSAEQIHRRYEIAEFNLIAAKERNEPEPVIEELDDEARYWWALLAEQVNG